MTRTRTPSVTRGAAAIALLTLLLAGCAAPPALEAEREPLPEPDLQQLVGYYATEELGAVEGASYRVLIDPVAWMVYDSCIAVSGQWIGVGSSIRIEAGSVGGDCEDESSRLSTVSTELGSVRALTFDEDASTWTLLDEALEPVATLVPVSALIDGPPGVDLQAWALEESEAPEALAQLAPVAPLPGGMRAPEAGELDGVWLLIGGDDEVAGGRLSIAGDGYDAEGGCGGGEFLVSDRGAFRAEAGRVDFDSCAIPSLQHLVLQTGRLGLDGEELVLFDRLTGEELGRLERVAE